MTKNKVMLAIPNLGYIHIDLARRVMDWLTTPSEHYEELGLFTPAGIVPHDAARNYIVRHFLASAATHLFFIDSDVVPPKDALDKLLAAQAPAISGLYATMSYDMERKESFKHYTVFKRAPNEKGDGYRLKSYDGNGAETARIDRCGGGCLLIERSTLEAIERPWFRFQYNDTGDIKYGEDIDFGAKLEKAGLPLYAHYGVVCAHHKEITL